MKKHESKVYWHKMSYTFALQTTDYISEKHKGIDFIQDFHMPDATTSLQMTRDENYIYATGDS